MALSNTTATVSKADMVNLGYPATSEVPTGPGAAMASDPEPRSDRAQFAEPEVSAGSADDCSDLDIGQVDEEQLRALMGGGKGLVDLSEAVRTTAESQSSKRPASDTEDGYASTKPVSKRLKLATTDSISGQEEQWEHQQYQQTSEKFLTSTSYQFTAAAPGARRPLNLAQEQARRGKGRLEVLLKEISTRSKNLKLKQQRKERSLKLQEKQADMKILSEKEEKLLFSQMDKEQRAQTRETEREEKQRAKEELKAQRAREREEARDARRKEAAEEARLLRIAREAERIRQKEERDAAKEADRLRKIEEAKRKLEQAREEKVQEKERNLGIEDLMIIFDVNKVLPKPKQLQWPAQYRDARERYDHLLPDAVSLVEFFFSLAPIFGATSSDITFTIDCIAKILFDSDEEAICLASRIHSSMLLLLLAEDVDTRVYYTEWLRSTWCTDKGKLDHLTFASLTWLYLESHIQFNAENRDCIEVLQTHDYCDIPPDQKLMILVFLQNQVLVAAKSRDDFASTFDRSESLKRDVKAIMQEQSDTLKSATTTTLPEILIEVYNAILEATSPEDGTPYHLIFVEVPDRDEYPEYYQVIKHPIDLNTILRRISDGTYTTLEPCFDDFKLLFANAHTFNEPGSWIHSYATALLEVLNHRRRVAELRYEMMLVGETRRKTATDARAAAIANGADFNEAEAVAQAAVHALPPVKSKAIEAYDEAERKARDLVAENNRNLQSEFLGSDRFHNQYYLFHTVPGLVMINAKLVMHKSPIGGPGEGHPPLPELRKRYQVIPFDESEAQQITREQHEKSALPLFEGSIGQFTEESELDAFMSSLLIEGSREKDLLANLQRRRHIVIKSMVSAQLQARYKSALNIASGVEGSASMLLLVTLKKLIIDLETKVADKKVISADLDRGAWEASMRSADSAKKCGELLSTFAASISPEAFKSGWSGVGCAEWHKELKEATTAATVALFTLSLDGTLKWSSLAKKEKQRDAELSAGVQPTSDDGGAGGAAHDCLDMGTHFDACRLCGTSGELLWCNSCPNCYHLECLTPPLSSVPVGDWFCESCRKEYPVVWAKVKGYPYWPARVVGHEASKVFLWFFGTNDHQWLAASKTETYTSREKELAERTVTKDKRLENSLIDVQEYVTRIRKRCFREGRPSPVGDAPEIVATMDEDRSASVQPQARSDTVVERAVAAVAVESSAADRMSVPVCAYAFCKGDVKEQCKLLPIRNGKFCSWHSGVLPGTFL